MDEFFYTVDGAAAVRAQPITLAEAARRPDGPDGRGVDRPVDRAVAVAADRQHPPGPVPAKDMTSVRW